MSIAKQHQPDNNTRKKPPPRELASNKSANAEVACFYKDSSARTGPEDNFREGSGSTGKTSFSNPPAKKNSKNAAFSHIVTFEHICDQKWIKIEGFFELGNAPFSREKMCENKKLTVKIQRVHDRLL